MKKKLRITFIIPFTFKTGGIAVILEYYRQLTSMGHEVSICYPLCPYYVFLDPPPAWNRRAWQLRMFLSNVKNFKRTIPLFTEDIPVKPVLFINNFSIPDADAVIATAWPTAYSVNSLSPKKGRKFYFVQGYEVWHGHTERVENSYRLPLGLITVSPYISAMMREKIGRDDLTEIHNGISLDMFYPPAAKDFNRISILLMAHDQELKGCKDAIAALSIVKERYEYAEIKMFGMCERPNAPFDFEYHKDPSYETLLSLYQGAAIFIFPSHGEGWGITPMEAMACKCAVVATNVGSIPVLNTGDNLILVDIKNPKSIADGIIRLIEDRALMKRVAEQGLERIREHGWAKSAQALISALQLAGDEQDG